MVDDHVFIIVCTVLFLVSGQDWIWRFFSALLFLVEADSRFCPKEVKRPPSCSPFDEPSESPSVCQRPSNAPSVSNAPTKAGKGGKGKNRAMKETSKSPKKSKEPKWGKGIKSQKCAN